MDEIGRIDLEVELCTRVLDTLSNKNSMEANELLRKVIKEELFALDTTAKSITNYNSMMGKENTGDVAWIKERKENIQLLTDHLDTELTEKDMVFAKNLLTIYRNELLNRKQSIQNSTAHVLG